MVYLAQVLNKKEKISKWKTRERGQKATNDPLFQGNNINKFHQDQGQSTDTQECAFLMWQI